MDAPLEAFVRINLGYGFRICGVLIYGFLINFKTKILIGSNFQCKHGLLFGQWLEISAAVAGELERWTI